jgi:hypothetical protein
MVFGEPNWRLLARLHELADDRSLEFVIGYSAGVWSVTIPTQIGGRVIGPVTGSFDAALSLAISAIEAIP